MMKKNLIILLILISGISFSQVGIGTTHPRGALDINKENGKNTAGLVLPTANNQSEIKNPQSPNSPIAIGTLFYDETQDCMKVYKSTGWSNCVSTTSQNGSPQGLVVVKNLDGKILTLTASAQNAISYNYDYGDGFSVGGTQATSTHTYLNAGVYTIIVTATLQDGTVLTYQSTVTIQQSYILKWADEFNLDGPPSSANWLYNTGASGWGNNEVQNYTNRLDNSYVSNGQLNIVAKKENYAGSQYTSARLMSKTKYSFKYGKIEIKAKLPSGQGTWPALWMLGSNIDAVNWPACGEIDIMEHVGSEPDRVHASTHYEGPSGALVSSTNYMDVNNVFDEFHIYGMEWDENQINFTVDGNVYHTIQNIPQTAFHNEFFIIMNVAMGGSWGGAIDPSFTSSAMIVDYIRVYQKQ